MRILLLPILAAGTALAACAPTAAERAAADQRAVDDQAGLAKELAGLRPEPKGTGCLNGIDQRNARSIKAYGPTIVYRVSDRLKYRTDTTGGCERIKQGDVLVTVSNAGQLCRGDIARTVDATNRFPTGSCSFGDFVAYRRP